jgi:hypothetical protein
MEDGGGQKSKSIIFFSERREIEDPIRSAP